jgi:NTP pyrophosphatase (non-canonical NTP hydrolase)
MWKMVIKMKDLNDKIIQWAEDRGIFEKSSPIKQQRKTVEEMGELFEAVNKGNTDDIKMEIGDVYVTLALQAKMQDIEIEEDDTLINEVIYNIDMLPAYIGEISNGVTAEYPRASFVDSINSAVDCLVVTAWRDNNLTLNECVQAAYDKISKRKGDMKDGIFIKDNEDKTESERVT